MNSGPTDNQSSDLIKVSAGERAALLDNSLDGHGEFARETAVPYCELEGVSGSSPRLRSSSETFSGGHYLLLQNRLADYLRETGSFAAAEQRYQKLVHFIAPKMQPEPIAVD